MKKLLIIAIILTFIFTLNIASQENDENDKFTTHNVMLKRVIHTSMGVIVEYRSGGKTREAYFPNSFFEEGIVVKLLESDSSATPQMNIIYKNNEQYKVKLYLHKSLTGLDYPVIEYLTPEIKEKFNSTDKLNIELFDTKTE